MPNPNPFIIPDSENTPPGRIGIGDYQAFPQPQSGTNGNFISYDGTSDGEPMAYRMMRDRLLTPDDISEMKASSMIQGPGFFTVLSKADRHSLEKANNTLQGELREGRNRSYREVDERESEYRDLVFSAKGVMNNPKEIIESEIPYCADYLSSDLMRKIVDSGHPDIFHNKGSSYLRCTTCARVLESHFMYFCLERLYCAEHVPTVEVCNICHYPKVDTVPVLTFDNANIRVCKKDLRRAATCGNCGAPISEAEVQVRMCAGCRSRNPSDGPLRHWSPELTFASDKNLGPKVQSPRMFSTEIELLLPNPVFVHKLSSDLPREVGLSGDGSISGDGSCLEIQSPRLAGAVGEILVESICKGINKYKGSVNDTCGMHIHIDGADLLPAHRKDYPKALLELWGAHLAFEDVVLSFVPYQRRFNRYSRPMRPYFTLIELEAVDNIMDAERLWFRRRSSEDIREAKSHHYDASRYFGINLHPLFASGHLEVRYHPGTIQADKILNWANLHTLIVDAAVSGKFTYGALSEAQNILELGAKTNFLFDLIGLSKESRKYFFSRQRKFRNRKEIEEGQSPVSVIAEPRRGRASRGLTFTEMAEELLADEEGF